MLGRASGSASWRGSSCRCSRNSNAAGDARALAANYYDVLGIDDDASDDDIRAAYRRRAKELHPDVNKEAGAADAFKQCKQAYETLSDAQRRRAYDAQHSARRLNFFQDVDETADQEEERPGGGWPGRPRAAPWETHRRMWEQQQQQDAETPDSSGDGSTTPLSPEEMLERLARVMGGGGPGGLPSMRAWGSGRLDPWGNSSSDAWHRRVEQQMHDPRGAGGRPLRGGGAGYGDDGAGYGDEGWGRRAPHEWGPVRRGDDAFERRPGWGPGGAPDEWRPPRRGGPGEDGDGEGDDGPRRRGGGGRSFPGGGGDSFRGKPL